MPAMAAVYRQPQRPRREHPFPMSNRSPNCASASRPPKEGPGSASASTSSRPRPRRPLSRPPGRYDGTPQEPVRAYVGSPSSRTSTSWPASPTMEVTSWQPDDYLTGVQAIACSTVLLSIASSSSSSSWGRSIRADIFQNENSRSYSTLHTRRDQTTILIHFALGGQVDYSGPTEPNRRASLLSKRHRLAAFLRLTLMTKHDNFLSRENPSARVGRNPIFADRAGSSKRNRPIPSSMVMADDGRFT